jgi:hypothetical protein
MLSFKMEQKMVLVVYCTYSTKYNDNKVSLREHYFQTRGSSSACLSAMVGMMYGEWNAEWRVMGTENCWRESRRQNYVCTYIRIYTYVCMYTVEPEFWKPKLSSNKQAAEREDNED